ncbi:pirin family protein, partial [Oceanospirillum sp. D5]|nr:pirin family protein [Oceanospirillum sediminis]
VSGNTLDKRDAIGVWDVNKIEILANENSEVIIIEVPMN